jgi:hypothetical protein
MDCFVAIFILQMIEPAMTRKDSRPFDQAQGKPAPPRLQEQKVDIRE